MNSLIKQTRILKTHSCNLRLYLIIKSYIKSIFKLVARLHKSCFAVVKFIITLIFKMFHIHSNSLVPVYDYTFNLRLSKINYNNKINLLKRNFEVSNNV